MKAFVLIQLNTSKERQVIEKLRALKPVKNAYVLFGEWDVIAEIDIENPEALGTFVIDKIRSMNEVELTSSLIVAA